MRIKSAFQKKKKKLPKIIIIIKCFAIRAPIPSSKARPENIHPPRSPLSTALTLPRPSPLGSGGRVLAPLCWIRRQLARRRPGRAGKGGVHYIVLERPRRGWKGVQCGEAGGSTRERERCAGYIPPFHPWAGRWVVFGDRGPSALALATGRRQSALGRGGGAPHLHPPPRPPGLAYKAPARRRPEQRRAAAAAALLRATGLRLASAGRTRFPSSLASALRTLPVGTMRGREVPLVLLALVLCLVSRGSAAPVTAGRATALAKMYTRGNHWAVGECPARSSPCGASRPPARVSASPAVPAARPWGAGFAPTFRPKRPPCPSASREAVGPSRCLPFSPGHPPSTQRFQIPEITLRGISLHHPLST